MQSSEETSYTPWNFVLESSVYVFANACHIFEYTILYFSGFWNLTISHVGRGRGDCFQEEISEDTSEYCDS